MKWGAWLACLWLTGCIGMPGKPADFEQQVNRLVEAEAYGQALTLIEQRLEDTPNDPQLQTRHQAVRSLATQYEVRYLRQAEALNKAERWGQLETLFVKALASYPESERLQRARADYASRRRESVEDIALQLTLLRGQWLVRSAPLYAEVESKGAPSEWRDQLRDYHEQRRETANRLHRYGQKALHEGDNELATQCLELSAALDPNSTVRTALGTARARQEGERTRHAAARQQRQQEDTARRVAELAGQCRQDLSDGRLGAARQCLDQLDELAPYSAEVAELRPAINAAVDRHVRFGIDRGRQHYSNGLIEQALGVWEPLLDLRPNNLELQTHVERARRVLRKLKQLGG